MNNDKLVDSLEIWGFEDNYIIYGDGSIGSALSVSPVDVSCWEDDGVNSLSERLCQFLNALPEDIDVQYIQDICKGNDEILSAHEATRHKECSEISTALSAERLEGLRSLDSEGLIPSHRLTMVVRKSLPLKGKMRSQIFSKPKKFDEISETMLRNGIKSLEKDLLNIESNLKSLGVATTRMTVDEVLDKTYEQWNPTRGVSKPPFNSGDVRSSILYSDLGITEEGFDVGSMHHRIISLKTLPDRTFASMAQVLRDLPFDSRLFLSVHVPKQAKELESLQTQRRIAFSMVNGKQNGVRDIESNAKLDDIETLLEQMVAQGEKIFWVSLNILLRSKNLETLDHQVNQTLMKIRELSGAEGMHETLGAMEVFEELSFPNGRAKERAKRLKTSELADFLPIYGPWKGHNRPSILMRSRLGNLVGFDPFDKGLTNANQIVSGGSGSGKSFMTNILMLQMLKERPKIFIIDIGGSYRKLCSNLGGQYIPLGLEGDLAMNPFDLLEGETQPSSQKIKFLVSLIEIMTTEEGDGRLPRLWRAEIEDAIRRVYDSTDRPRLSDLKNDLGNHFDSEIKRLSRTMSQWVGDSAYGQFVDRPTTIELNRPLVCFDLKGLESNPDLQAACLFIITDFVWREVQADKVSKKFMIFDECWRLLESEAGGQFIGDVFRTFRKYFASAIAISQNIDDFAKSKIAAAILPNASTKWVLKQKGADQARLQEVLDLNKNEMALIESLHQERGKYSEAFLMCEDDRSLVAIESTPLEYWIATTDPRETSLIQRRLQERPEMTEWGCLQALSKEYPTGLMGKEV
jgi:conjugal transfer ATP-binding protein TraC